MIRRSARRFRRKTGAEIYCVRFFKCKFLVSQPLWWWFLSRVGLWGFGDEKWGKLLLKQSLWRRRPNAWLSITELSTVRELINAESADVWKRSSWAAITVAGERNGTIQSAPLIFQATLDDCELLSYFNANKLFIVAVCSLSLPEHSLRRIFAIFYSISCNFLRLSSPPTKTGRAKKTTKGSKLKNNCRKGKGFCRLGWDAGDV